MTFVFVRFRYHRVFIKLFISDTIEPKNNYYNTLFQTVANKSPVYLFKYFCL